MNNWMSICSPTGPGLHIHISKRIVFKDIQNSLVMGKHISSWTVWKIASNYQSSAYSVLIISSCKEIFDSKIIILKSVHRFWMIRKIIVTVKKQVKIDESNKIDISSMSVVSIFIVSSISLCWSEILLICAIENIMSRESLVLLLL